MISFRDFCLKESLIDSCDDILFNISENDDVDDLIQFDDIPDTNDNIIIKFLSKLLDISGNIGTALSPDGLKRVKRFIKSDILGSKEIRAIIRHFNAGDYQGFKGYERMVRELKEKNPSLIDSLLTVGKYLCKKSTY